MSVFEEVKKIILNEINCDAAKVTMEAKLKDDLGADSIDAVQIVMEIEDKYGITIDEDKAETMVTVGDVVKYIEENK
ncbi:MAG: acyl carrier protein [Acholeplasmatales bacterium]|jgi:acyl carrier protein|nr:acyl carrier protein [Acholeplasmatales bacterium]